MAAPASSSPDPFDALGLPARFDLDAETVRRAWLARSAGAHPDGDHRGRAYRRGEKDAGISSLFSCRTGRTPDWGGHWPSLRDSSRMRVRSLESL